jgi:hypothetical protein
MASLPWPQPSPGGAGGASYPFHEIQHLKGEARARHLMPISDTHHDEAWAASRPDTVAQIIASSPGVAFAFGFGLSLAGQPLLSSFCWVLAPVQMLAARWLEPREPAEPGTEAT